jgi:hypothetical protein
VYTGVSTYDQYDACSLRTDFTHFGLFAPAIQNFMNMNMFANSVNNDIVEIHFQPIFPILLKFCRNKYRLQSLVGRWILGELK